MKLLRQLFEMDSYEANRERADSDHDDQTQQAFKQEFTNIEDLDVYTYPDDIISDMKRDGFNDKQIAEFAAVTSRVGQHIDQLEAETNEEAHFDNAMAKQLSRTTDRMQEFLNDKKLKEALDLHQDISAAVMKHVTTFSKWSQSPEAGATVTDNKDREEELSDPYGTRGVKQSDF